MVKKQVFTGLATSLAFVACASGCDPSDVESQSTEEDAPELEIESDVRESSVEEKPFELEEIDLPGQFYNVVLGDDTRVVFAKSEAPEEYRSEGESGEQVLLAAVGGASLDELLEIPEVGTAPLSHVYVGLGGTLEAAPQRFRIEIEGLYGSDRLTFEPGELIDRVTQAYHIKSGRTKNSSWCKSYSAFKDKSWDMSVSSKGRHYRSSTKTRALGVHPPDGGNLRAIGQVCNYNSGGKFDNDVIEATFNWGWIDVGPTTPQSVHVIKIWNTKRLKVKDGRRAYFSRSLPRHLDTNEGYYVTASDVSGADTGLRRYVSIFLGGKNENGR